MTKHYQRSLHIFRRDLRLQDNSALIDALRLSEEVIPCFIFDPRQIDKNDYKSQSCLQIMAAALNELDEALKKKGSRLFCFDGLSEKVIEKLIAYHDIDAVFINRDYTPFSRARDAHIEASCHKQRVAFHSHADALLHEPEECLKADNKPYTVFSHFFRRAAMLPVNAPTPNRYQNYYKQTIAGANYKTLEKLLKINNPELIIKGGRAEAIRLLKKIPNFADYKDMRNIPEKDATTHLSGHHKFGTASIRETYAIITDTFGRHHTLINELYWRDFYTHIGYHFPHVFGASFREKYDDIQWDGHAAHLQRWCEGTTGFPIVDAGMRELNTTGFMHNRVRMITASFLTKDLHINWREGEKYFAQQLVDYDPAVNNGSWQWSASTGCDAQPYFRIFNPWLQQKKFDPDCLYIKKWIPELKDVNPKDIHKLLEKPLPKSIGYPAPIIEHRAASLKAKALFKHL